MDIKNISRRAYGTKESHMNSSCSDACPGLFFTNMSKEELEAKQTDYGRVPCVESVVECSSIGEKVDLNKMWEDMGSRGPSTSFDVPDSDGQNVSIIYRLSGHRCGGSNSQFVGIVDAYGGEECRVYDNEGMVVTGPGANLGRYPEERFGYVAFAKGLLSPKIAESSSDAVRKLKEAHPGVQLEDDDIFVFTVGCYVDPDNEKVI